jgi:hypothetical protein
LLAELTRAPRLMSALLAAMALAACTTSESVSLEDGATAITTGASGGPGSGAAGTSGGGAGTGNPTSSGAAGTTGAAGAGAAQTGAAGRSGTGAADTGAAGTGTTGAAGRGDAGGASAADAGAGSDAASDAMQLTYTNYMGPIMTLNNCGGCHYIGQGIAIQGGFGLSYANVMGAVTAAHAGCPNLDASKRRVVPGKPDNSLIYIKVAVPNLPSSCGGHMPYMGYEWSDNYKQGLRTWILQGAKE